MGGGRGAKVVMCEFIATVEVHTCVLWGAVWKNSYDIILDVFLMQ